MNTTPQTPAAEYICRLEYAEGDILCARREMRKLIADLAADANVPPAAVQRLEEYADALDGLAAIFPHLAPKDLKKTPQNNDEANTTTDDYTRHF